MAKVVGLSVAFVLAAAILLPLSKGMKCIIKLEVPDEWEKILRDCYESNPPKYAKYPMPNATIDDFDFDDNCYNQCFYKAAGLLTLEGKPIKETKDKISALLKKSELDADILEKITGIWNECSETAEKIGKEKGFDDCKIIGLHDFCFHEQTYENKGLLEKKC